MVALFSDSDAQVVVALIVLVGTLVGLFVQNQRTHRDNRNDHAETARKVDVLLENQTGIRSDIAEIRDDVRDVKAEVREHGARLRAVEAPKPRTRRKADPA